MNERRESEIRMIPLEKITVLNPRERGKRKFKQIVDSIAKLGLKKPVTVTPKKPGGDEYYLVCGQGRLEGYEILGETEIPAIVVYVNKEKLFLMSLVENLARRQHSSIELVRRIAEMRDRGDSFAQIADKTALTVSYVRGVVKLLKKGEERLVQAVEKGQVPLNVAITIATSDDQEIQKALTEAYEKNALRGKKLLAVRRLVEQRKTSGKTIHGGNGRQNGSGISSEELLRTYNEETARQRLVIQKARLCETRLLFAVSALRKLFEDEHFVVLLRAESLDTLPAYLATQIHGEEQ